MTRATRKRIVMGLIGAIVLALLVFAFLPKPVPVRTAVVVRGPLQVTVEEEGRTEIADRYEIASPVGAFLRRIALKAATRSGPDNLSRGWRLPARRSSIPAAGRRRRSA